MVKGLTILIVLSSTFVIFARSISYSLSALILTFIVSSILFIYIGQPLFGFLYLLVYSAAISILFLFVLMMLDLPVSSSLSFSSFFLFSFFLFMLSFSFSFLSNSLLFYHYDWPITSYDTLQYIAYSLYTNYSFLLILLVYGLFIVLIAILLSFL